MSLDVNKYNTLFLEKFKANESQLQSEFNRIIKERGDNDKVKLEFYEALFNLLIAQIKKEIPKTEDYEYIISTLYNYFIQALEEDNFDATKFKTELTNFKTNKVPKANSTYEPVYKDYNKNTQYGRRKAREQAIRNYENGTQEYRNEYDKTKRIVWFMILVIIAVIFAIKSLITHK